MSLAFDFRVDIRPYSGYSDPSLPIGSWIAEGGAAGNASGGIMTMRFLFQRDGDAQISELFSVEQLAIDTTNNLAQTFVMRTQNMDSLAPSRAATDQRWFVTTDAINTVGESAMGLSKTILPLWLGTPNRNEGDAGLAFETLNTDLLLYFIGIQGYLWGPRSVLADGGPRRPVGGGLYRS